MARLSKFMRMRIPEYDDPIVIANDFNAAMDALDLRVGANTEQDWTVQTAPTTAGFTTSAKELRLKRFNKTVCMHAHYTVSGATGFFEVTHNTAWLLSGEAGYEANNESSFTDIIGWGAAIDVSTGNVTAIDVRPSGLNNNRLEFSTTAGSFVTNTNPFTWAAGDILTYTMIFQTGAPA